MPNGKPGDHPLTDILLHSHETYGSEADELIRRIAELSSRRELDEWWEANVGWSADKQHALQQARSRHAQLLKRAQDHGWETE